MRLLLCSFILTIFLVGSASGQAGQIGVYSDAGGVNCNLVDNSPGILSVYVVLTQSLGATGVRFAAPMPACMIGASWLSDSPCDPPCGNSQTGMTISFGQCLSDDIHVTTISYVVQGTTLDCCLYPVTPDPSTPSGKIEVVDCSSQVLYSTGRVNTINANRTCECAVLDEVSSWGKLKALYID
jgi:hypothetical protein